MIMTNITARDFKLTKGIEDMLNEKLSKIEKYSDREKEVNVVLTNEPNGQKAEILYNLNGKVFKAEGVGEDLYAAMDIVVQALQKQVRRFTDKQKDNGNESIRFKKPITKSHEGVSTKSKIVKRKVISAKPMFEEEAVLQMDLLDHRSFLFYNADTNTPCMIYKRHDGNYGIIETDIELHDSI